MKHKLGKKKIILVITAVILVIAIGIGIWFGVSRGRAEPVNVYPFEYLGMTEYWGDSQESYGPVTTDKIQTIYLSSTQTVTEIKVTAGDTVKKGDILMTFDTTLDDLALERKRLDVEKLKLQLEDAEAELREIKNMKPMVIPEYTEKEDEGNLGTALSGPYKISTQKSYDGSTQGKSLICWLSEGTSIDDDLLETLRQTASAYQTVNAQKAASSASAPEGDSDGIALIDDGEDGDSEDGDDEGGGNEGDGNEGGGNEGDGNEGGGNEGGGNEGGGNEGDGNEGDGNEGGGNEGGGNEGGGNEGGGNEGGGNEGGGNEGTGGENPDTPEDSPVEPVDVSNYYVIFKITSGNMSLGSRIVWQGVHVTGREANGFSLRFFDAYGISDYTLAQETTSSADMPQIDFGSGYTAAQIAQMRSEQEKKIKDLKFDIKMAEADYKIMQTEVSDGNVYAEIDGEVVSALTEDEAKQTQQPILKVSGGGGFYIEGSISELEKDNLQIGQEVTVNDWNTGMTYTGEVVSMGDFPSSDGYWNGIGNPNTSYYPFNVFIDGSADLQAGMYASVMFSTSTGENGIYLQNPFVRTEQGRSYVYVQGENSKLEKRYVTTGKSLWGSYTEITSGLTVDDYIAFPYGKTVKEGAPTVESDLSTLYDY